MSEEELKQHIFLLSEALDRYSAGKDYVALRTTHYANIEWLNKHGLTEDYYKVLFKHTSGKEEEWRR